MPAVHLACEAAGSARKPRKGPPAPRQPAFRRHAPAHWTAAAHAQDQPVLPAAGPGSGPSDAVLASNRGYAPNGPLSNGAWLYVSHTHPNVTLEGSWDVDSLALYPDDRTTTQVQGAVLTYNFTGSEVGYWRPTGRRLQGDLLHLHSVDRRTLAGPSGCCMAGSSAMPQLCAWPVALQHRPPLLVCAQARMHMAALWR